MKNGLKTLFYLLLLHNVWACKHEPVLIAPTPTILEKSDSCSVKNVTYKTTVKAIFDDHCIRCHGNTIMSKGMNFQGYESLKLWFSLDSLRLLHAIRHEKGLPMPLGGDKIPDCKIRQIETWVREGYKEN
jgi:mono/diheme cytochrome c family protein